MPNLHLFLMLAAPVTRAVLVPPSAPAPNLSDVDCYVWQDGVEKFKPGCVCLGGWISCTEGYTCMTPDSGSMRCGPTSCRDDPAFKDCPNNDNYVNYCSDGNCACELFCGPAFWPPPSPPPPPPPSPPPPLPPNPPSSPPPASPAIATVVATMETTMESRVVNEVTLKQIEAICTAVYSVVAEDVTTLPHVSMCKVQIGNFTVYVLGDDEGGDKGSGNQVRQQVRLGIDVSDVETQNKIVDSLRTPSHTSQVESAIGGELGTIIVEDSFVVEASAPPPPSAPPSPPPNPFNCADIFDRTLVSSCKDKMGQSGCEASYAIRAAADNPMNVTQWMACYTTNASGTCFDSDPIYDCLQPSAPPPSTPPLSPASPPPSSPPRSPPPPPHAPPAAPASKKGGGLSAGAIGGIAGGAVVGAGAIAAIVCLTTI